MPCPLPPCSFVYLGCRGSEACTASLWAVVLLSTASRTAHVIGGSNAHRYWSGRGQSFSACEMRSVDDLPVKRTPSRTRFQWYKYTRRYQIEGKGPYDWFSSHLSLTSSHHKQYVVARYLMQTSIVSWMGLWMGPRIMRHTLISTFLASSSIIIIIFFFFFITSSYRTTYSRGSKAQYIRYGTAFNTIRNWPSLLLSPLPPLHFVLCRRCFERDLQGSWNSQTFR